MSAITRETLALAALAAGMTYRDDLWTCGHMQRDDGLWEPWRPHTDIAEAARLDMEINIGHGQVAATVGEWWDWARVKHNGTEPDKERAYCEAITLCAAQIGKRMREGGR